MLAFVAALVVVFLLLEYLSEVILERFIEPYNSADARRARHPPGSHPHPTPPLETTDFVRRAAVVEGRTFAVVRGKKIFWQRLAPAQAPPTCIVVFFHGFEDHSDFALYNTACLFVERMAVIALLVDLPGHGRSDGLHGLVRDWRDLEGTVRDWLDITLEQERFHIGFALPLFAFGSSMGGAIAVSAALDRPQRFQGLLLVAPMLRIGRQYRPPWIVEALLKVMALVPIVGYLPLVPRRDRTAANYAAAAKWRLDEHRALNKLAYGGRTRLRTARALLFATDLLAESMHMLTTPFLVMHGTLDTATSPETSRELVQRAAVQDKELHLVDGAVHGLHYGEVEAVMAKVHLHMLRWLHSRAASGAVPPSDVVDLALGLPARRGSARQGPGMGG